jgi:hypothetical protein
MRKNPLLKDYLIEFLGELKKCFIIDIFVFLIVLFGFIDVII